MKNYLQQEDRWSSHRELKIFYEILEELRDEKDQKELSQFVDWYLNNIDFPV
ncbi:hypothetical protein [Planococcus sp. S3-L1]|uniref:hypothetical protein n=1 Tax=Planococcus sp. S3-L1 TaxID=3046200 RepID=UPI0024B95243|nr:hypothetical protein [Planococcus sp. S3-L1]MDJ0333574.1 hypothetical protein [Planococcus sp. S3-L1]